MLEHPGTELQVLIKEKGLTQKAFASILGKKVSEVNELLKGKRNITIQRDYLLHQTLGTPIKYWILKQIDYDYSLLDIEETSVSPLRDGKSHKSSLPGEDLDGAAEGLGEIGRHSEHSEESSNHQASHSEHPASHSEHSEESSNHQASHSEHPASHSEHSEESSNHQASHSEPNEIMSDDPEISPLDKRDTAKPSGFEQSQEAPVQEPKNENDEDFKNRARIFKTF